MPLADYGVDPQNPGVRQALADGLNEGVYNGAEVYRVLATPDASLGWTHLQNVPHNGQDTQQAILTGFDALRAYRVAMQARSGDVPTVGYEGDDPDAWTASTAALSMTTLTTGCSVPILNSATWIRVSPTLQIVRLVWSLTDLFVPVLVQKSTDGSAWTDVILLNGLQTPRTYDYTIPDAESGTVRYFRVLPVRGTLSGTASNHIAVYLGASIAPTIAFCCYDPDDTSVFLLATNAGGATHIQVEVGYFPDFGGAAVFNYTAHPSGIEVLRHLDLPVGSGVAVHVRIRNGRQVGSALDWGSWVTTSLPASAAPGTPREVVNIPDLLGDGNPGIYATLGDFYTFIPGSGVPPALACFWYDIPGSTGSGKSGRGVVWLEWAGGSKRAIVSPCPVGANDAFPHALSYQFDASVYGQVVTLHAFHVSADPALPTTYTRATIDTTYDLVPAPGP